MLVTVYLQAYPAALQQQVDSIEPDYHRLEFEVRVYLARLNAGRAKLWGD